MVCFCLQPLSVGTSSSEEADADGASPASERVAACCGNHAARDDESGSVS